MESDPGVIVQSFASSARYEALTRLQALGPAAVPAVRAGLKHPDWHVRHWCAIYFDRVTDPDLLSDLVPLLSDPVTQVRLWAVHSLACEHCKPGACPPIDIVPLLIERVERDTSTRVRKMAVAMLGTLAVDVRIAPVLAKVLESGPDAKVRLHADLALRKYRAAGLA